MARDRNLINAFDDCVQRLESGETLEVILKDYPESAQYLRDLLMISEMVAQVHDEDDETTQAQSRGRDKLKQALQEKPKRKLSRRPRWYLPTVAAAIVTLIIGFGIVWGQLLRQENFINLDLTRTAIAETNFTGELDLRPTQTQQALNAQATQVAVLPTQSQYDAFEMTATQLIADLTQTATSAFANTMDAQFASTSTVVPSVGDYDPFELTATQLVAEVTANAISQNPVIPTASSLDAFSLTATQLINDLTATANGQVFATPSPYVENFDITATALMMPTITLVGTPLPSGTLIPLTSVIPMVDTTENPIPTAIPAENIVLTIEVENDVRTLQAQMTMIQVAGQPITTVELTATSLANLYSSTSSVDPNVVSTQNAMPDTGGGNGVENAIKTTSLPPSLSTGTGTPTPAPTQTIASAGTQVADGSVIAPLQNDNNQPTPLPALIPLQAGEIDDNADWDTYLLYRREFLARGFPVNDLDVTGQQIITVIDDNGLPVLGATVRVFANDELLGETLTYATGQTLFFPNIDERSRGVNEFFVMVEKDGVSQQFMLNRNEGSTWRVTLPLSMNRDNVELDVLFLIDTTSSMGDEIGQLQNNILHISEQVSNFADNVDVRYGLVLYREHDNFEYLTRRHEFTRNVDEFQTYLNAVTANSGDNNPDWDEALNVGLNESLNMMTWRNENTIKLIFLVADARPHIDHPLEPRPYDESILYALSRGIKIHPIASSGLEPAGEYIFRQIAQVTMGHFLFLTYDAGLPGTTGDVRPELNVGDPETTDPIGGYTVDRLADVVLRLIQDEILYFRGLNQP